MFLKNFIILGWLAADHDPVLWESCSTGESTLPFVWVVESAVTSGLLCGTRSLSSAMNNSVKLTPYYIVSTCKNAYRSTGGAIPEFEVGNL